MKESRYRVLHLNTRFLGIGASGEIMALVNGLNPQRYEIDLAFGEDSGSLYDIERALASHVRVVRIKDLRREIELLADLRAFVQIHRLIKRRRYHLVHTHSSKAAFLGRLAAHLAGTPLIIHGLKGTTFHQSQPVLVRSLFISLEKLAGRFTDFFIPVGQDLMDKYLAADIGRSDQYAVVHTGMDLERFFSARDMSKGDLLRLRSQFSFSPDDFVFCKVATMEPNKGYIYAIQAAAGILKKFDRVRFLFVGEGSQRPLLEKRVGQLGLTGKVVFAGYRTEVPELMSMSNALIHTSLREGLPQVFIQACATRRPIVTFAVEGAHEIVQKGDCGFVVPIGDVPELIRKMQYLVENPKQLEVLGRQAQRVVDDSWTKEAMVASTDSIYMRLLSGIPQLAAINQQCIHTASPLGRR